MQQSEISPNNSSPDSSQEKLIESLIEKLGFEEDRNKKNEIYRKIEIEIIKNKNINSAGINYRMRNYFSKKTEPNEFDKNLMKLMLSCGWKIPQDFPELDSLNIKESRNNFYFQDVEIKIQDYKKTYESLPIKIEEHFQRAFLDSLSTAFDYLVFCSIPFNNNEVEYNKKNILRIDVNGVELGFSAIGLHDFLENIVIKKDQKELSFLEFVKKFGSEKEENFEENFMTLKARCILDRQMVADFNFAKEVIEHGIDIRSSIESSRRGSLQNFSSRRSSFQEPSSRRNSFQDYLPSLHKTHDNEVKILKLEGDKFVIKDPDPTCFSFLKSIFCNCFGKKNQQDANKNSLEALDPKPSSDHSIHPSTSFVVERGASFTLDRRDIALN